MTPQAGTVILLRHTRPDCAAGNRYLGWSDPPLGEAGRRTAEQVARLLAQRPVDGIICSPLRRARETTAIMAAARIKAAPAEEDERLKEINFGAFEGKTFAEASQSHPREIERWSQDPENFVFPGGEAISAFSARVREAGLALCPRIEENQNAILIVAHAGSLRVLAGAWLGLSPSQYWALRLEYAGWATIRFTGGEWGELVELASPATFGIM